MLSSLYVRLEARLSLFLKIFGKAGWGCFVNVMVSDNRKFFLFFFKQKTAYEITTRLVGSEMCIRDRHRGIASGRGVATKR